MKLQVYSVKDLKAEVYNRPFFNLTHGEAERNFRELANDPNGMVGKYPDDYDLYHLGEYDDLTGKITSLDTPRHVIKAVSAIKPKAPLQSV